MSMCLHKVLINVALVRLQLMFLNSSLHCWREEIVAYKQVINTRQDSPPLSAIDMPVN